MEIKPVNPIQCGPLTIGDGRLTLIAGPCMAETLEVCLETAEFLKNLTAELNVQYIFKASYDKANRTSNDSKRGPGMERGLEMLAEVKTRFDVPVITDVHEHEEVPRVAEVADVLQIPAFLCRQTDLLHAAGRERPRGQYQERAVHGARRYARRGGEGPRDRQRPGDADRARHHFRLP